MDGEEKIDYLEVDNPIPGQNYVCVSFISPENVIKQKELFMFNKYMNQRCGEYEIKIDKIIEGCSDNMKEKVGKELKDELLKELKFGYETFKSKFDDFKYKFNDELEKAFNVISDNKTSVRGVKIRGIYDSYREAETRAKTLQRKDRSFHVFVGQVGYWLPWDPNADRVQDEEYLEDELNNLMKGYKQNDINRDLFYEEQKREKIKAAAEEKRRQESQNKSNVGKLEEPDPWMQSKFKDAPENDDADGDASGEASGEASGDASGEASGEAGGDTSKIKEI